jgi:four helix bundle protein
MSLLVQQVALEAIAALRPLLPLIRRSDRALADQLARAASSVVLNLAEGACSDPGNRRARYFSAAGSANEARAALRVAVTWGYFAAERAVPAEALLDRVVAMAWRLTHPRGQAG